MEQGGNGGTLTKFLEKVESPGRDIAEHLLLRRFTRFRLLPVGALLNKKKQLMAW